MKKKPNYVIFLTDDQGYADLSCMGSSDFQTPNIDRMAAEGIRFRSWYCNSSVCSPSRASLLTGRYPARAGVRSILHGHRTATGLPANITTLPKALKKLGYNTYMAGKWHLGLADESRPHSQGFDKWFGFMSGCVDYFSHIFYFAMNVKGPCVNPIHDLWENNSETWNYNGEYMTDLITRKSIEYIREAVRKEEPFFLYVPYNAPHYPMHAPKKYMDRFKHLPWDKQAMAAMLSAVDDGVGEISSELEKLGVSENTCTFYMSDNGPSRESRNWLDGTSDPYYGGGTGKLKGHKFSLFEGGIRVPGIMRWPKQIKPGQISDRPFAAMDIFPTFLKASGGDPGKYDIDGIDIISALNQNKPLERHIFWELLGQKALRKGDWKLVLDGKLYEGQFKNEAPVFLSNLARDMGENQNLASEEADITCELKEELETWFTKIESEYKNITSDSEKNLIP